MERTGVPGDAKGAATLADSAFARLGVSARADTAAITQAHDRLSFDQDHALAPLDEARARLLSPRDRLDEELRWLPELSPAAARAAGAAVTTRVPVDVRRARDAAPGLARVNLGLALLDLAAASDGDVRRVLDDALAWSPDVTRRFVDEARALAGFKPVPDDGWAAAVARHRRLIAGRLGAAFAALPRAAASLADRAGTTPARADAALLLDEVVIAYGQGTSAETSRLRARIETATAALRENADAQGQVWAIEEVLGTWAPVTRPPRRRAAARGVEDGEGEALFWSIRDLAVYLANDHARPADAQALSRALEQAFADTPVLLEKARSDLAELAELVAGQQEAIVLVPLQAAHDDALARPRAFAEEIVAGALNGERPRPHAFARAFHAARRATLSNPQLPWLIARDVAVKLHNEHDLTAAAEALLLWLLALSPPADMVAKLETDLDAARDVVVARDFHAAMAAGDPARALELLGRLPPETVGGATQHAALKRSLEEKLGSRRFGKYALAGIAALIVLAIASSESGGGGSTYSIDNTMVTDMSTLDPAGTIGDEIVADGSTPDWANAPASPPDDGTQEPPPPYGFGTLTRPQLRWCAFESARIDVAQAMPSVDVSAVNAAVRDFNGRCSSTRYSSLDRAAIDFEVAAAAMAIRREVNARFELAPPPVPPPAPALDLDLGSDRIGTSVPDTLGEASEPAPLEEPGNGE